MNSEINLFLLNEFSENVNTTMELAAVVVILEEDGLEMHLFKNKKPRKWKEEA